MAAPATFWTWRGRAARWRQGPRWAERLAVSAACIPPRPPGDPVSATASACERGLGFPEVCPPPGGPTFRCAHSPVSAPADRGSQSGRGLVPPATRPACSRSNYFKFPKPLGKPRTVPALLHHSWHLPRSRALMPERPGDGSVLLSSSHFSPCGTPAPQPWRRQRAPAIRRRPVTLFRCSKSPAPASDILGATRSESPRTLPRPRHPPGPLGWELPAAPHAP